MKKLIFIILFLTSCSAREISYEEQSLTIASLTPMITEILVDLNAGEYIIAKDIHSERFGIQNTASFDMFALDMESLIALNPDIIFISFMPELFESTVLEDRVYTFPTANSIHEIEEQINKIGSIISRNEEAEILINEMNEEIENVLYSVGSLNIEGRRVYFEIGAHPIFTIGSGVFLNEIIEMLGAVNIFADYEGWIQAIDEEIIVRNPYVIVTSVGYVEDPVLEIINRPGFEVIDAVINERVIAVEPLVTSVSNHRTSRAIYYIANAIFPEIRD